MYPLKSAILPEVRKKIAARNKARSQAMERQVAKDLRGNRVPMSGSGQIKGDCLVPYDEYRTIYVECKLTEKDVLTVYQTWLAKIQEDTKSMRCIFGILVISFLRKGKIVLVPEQAEPYLTPIDFSAIMKWTHAYESKGIKVEHNVTPRKIQTLAGYWTVLPYTQFKIALESLA